MTHQNDYTRPLLVFGTLLIIAVAVGFGLSNMKEIKLPFGAGITLGNAPTPLPPSTPQTSNPKEMAENLIKDQYSLLELGKSDPTKFDLAWSRLTDTYKSCLRRTFPPGYNSNISEFENYKLLWRSRPTLTIGNINSSVMSDKEVIVHFSLYDSKGQTIFRNTIQTIRQDDGKWYLNGIEDCR